MWIIILQRLILEAAFDVVYFPVWWYTGGIVFAIRKCFDLLKFGNEWLAPGVWLRNLFVPMFGQYDWVGRIISFFMRLVNIFARGGALLLWSVMCVVLFMVWLILPVLIVYGILGGSFIKK